MLCFSSSVASIFSPVLLLSEDKALRPSPEPVLQFLFHSQVGRSRRPCLVFIRMEANVSRCFKNKFYLREDKSVQTSSKEWKLVRGQVSSERDKCRLLFYPLTLSHLLLHASAYLPIVAWQGVWMSKKLHNKIVSSCCLCFSSCHWGAVPQAGSKGFLLDKEEDSSSMELPIGLVQAASPQMLCSPLFSVCFGFL